MTFKTCTVKAFEYTKKHTVLRSLSKHQDVEYGNIHLLNLLWLVLRNNGSHCMAWRNMLSAAKATRMTPKIWGLTFLRNAHKIAPKHALHCCFTSSTGQLWSDGSLKQPCSLVGRLSITVAGTSTFWRLAMTVVLLVRVRRLWEVWGPASASVKTPLMHQELQAL